MVAVFLHGVPDTPDLWAPLLSALKLPPNLVRSPAFPGFVSPAPVGFSRTKEAYLNWVIETLEIEASATGPVDLVGHDWGAALTVKAAHERPDLVRSWVVMGAVPLPGARWHKTARIWQTPLMGELFMLLASGNRLKSKLIEAGMPPDLAAIEAPQVKGEMKRSILKLYRSAIDLGDEWGSDLSQLPKRGLLIWGEKDPFIRLKVAQRFSEDWGHALHVEPGAGHWAPFERPSEIAERLVAHWA